MRSALLLLMMVLALSIDVQRQLDNLLLKLKGKRVGFLTNPTGVDNNLKPIFQTVLDRSSEFNLSLICFFAPEHGLRGDRQAGAGDDDYVDSETQLPVYSLYGKRLAPTADQLATIDVLVYDIQDVGSRYYTYMWTLTYTMEALLGQNKTLFVFDRPNPLGSKIEGCVLSIDAGSIGRLLPGQKFSIPVRYGLTVGQFVKYVVRFIGALQYEIVEMLGYDPDSISTVDPSKWVLSSPNMPTLDTVFVYPGMGIFEGTSASEGRGTTKPFELSGVAGLSAQNLTKTLRNISLKGAILRPTYFIPTFSKFQNSICGGVQIHITDREIFEPVRTAFQLLKAYYKLSPNITINNGIDKMVGFSGFAVNIKYFDPDDILANCKANLTLYDQERQSILIYKRKQHQNQIQSF